ncbi:hypothetical protein GCM10011509_25610 [Ornithinimicrobium pekingense]|uniref:GNAT family N-acetyltransferase n=1 Tax=Ornithinimicrobium pekingense TaxID=384677 RepID=A0ABQ2F9W8_9MICO|nr:hypothetical protein GCM10011509_25610 [Ornithinimicrobium pekingense]
MQPDAGLGESRSLVEEVDGRVVAAGLRVRSTRDDADLVELMCEPGHGAELLRALVAADDRPVWLRVVPGTPTAHAVAEVGHVEVMQSLPPAAIPSGDPDVHAWAHGRLGSAERDGIVLRRGTELTLDQLLDLWMEAYLPAHESFAPVKDVAETRETFRTWFSRGLDREATFVALAGDGRALAGSMMTSEIDGILVPAMIELAPEHPSGTTGAAACVAATLLAVSPRAVELEGHVDQRLYMSVLETIPHRSAGVLTPMDMVRIQGVDAPRP